MLSPFQSVAPQLAVPQSEAIAAFRAMLTKFGVPSDVPDELIAKTLLSSGIQAAPLLGRKVAISGSATLNYQYLANGSPIIGIGDAVAEGMLMNGASVVLNSNTPTMNQERLGYLRDTYKRPVEYAPSDMSTEEGARSFVDNAYKALNGLDVLVLNAGTYIDQMIPNATREIAERTFALNFWGPREAALRFVELVGDTVKAGRIIFTSSINAQLSESAHLSYDASKAALEGLARSMAIEIAKKKLDITVNCVSPGLVYSPLTYAPIVADPEVHRSLDEGIPLGIGWARDLVPAYVALAAANSSYETGTVVDVSGGLRITQGTERYPHGRSDY